MKRKSSSNIDNRSSKKIFIIDDDFLKKCSEDFNNSNANIIAKNIVTNVGSLHATTDYDVSRNVSHTFLNTLKKKNLKATNQGASGRCWIFSGLNVFRHNVIEALELENFEFSETYIFFWDKFERANSYLQWINELVYKGSKLRNDDNMFKYLVDKEKWMSDGGYWSCFANLVDKYGLIPKKAMPETFQSEYSEDMNDVLMDILHSTSNELYTLSKNDKKRDDIIVKSLQQIYDSLVKFLGEPPKTFTWDFTTEAGESNIIENLDPLSFKNIVAPKIDLKDFVLLSNIPSESFKYNQKYSITNTNNVIEGSKCEFINLPISELKKYSKKSILEGLPVWFAGDVKKGFHPIHSTLNDKITKSELLFGDRYKMTKKDRILFTNQETSHAMTLLGVNLDIKGNSISWQVENSWGFYDNETPGLDGFLCMDESWFDEYLGQVVIHKKFLSRSTLKLLEQEPIEIKPWESLAPALKVNIIKRK
jgi:bleomycin hydrolase